MEALKAVGPFFGVEPVNRKDSPLDESSFRIAMTGVAVMSVLAAYGSEIGNPGATLWKTTLLYGGVDVACQVFSIWHCESSKDPSLWIIGPAIAIRGLALGKALACLNLSQIAGRASLIPVANAVGLSYYRYFRDKSPDNG